MRKLKIRFVQRLAHLPEGVVEVCVHFGKEGVNVGIVRQGFIASRLALEAITERGRQLLAATAGDRRPIAGAHRAPPLPSADWYGFVDSLFRQDDSWAFIVQPDHALLPS